jgi:hypothetical protein
VIDPEGESPGPVLPEGRPWLSRDTTLQRKKAAQENCDDLAISSGVCHASISLF